jgi:hypothetical protein
VGWLSTETKACGQVGKASYALLGTYEKQSCAINMVEARDTIMHTVIETISKVNDVGEEFNQTKTHASPPQGNSNETNGIASHNQSDYLHVFDSRTWKIHNIPILDGFVRGSDLSTITAPIPGQDGRMQKLAVLDPGFQHTACKESAITLM